MGFGQVMKELTIKKFRETLGEYADQAMLEWVKIHAPEGEHEELERAAKEDPESIHIAAAVMAVEDLNNLNPFLELCQETIAVLKSQNEQQQAKE
jgi:hypothetical protein